VLYSHNHATGPNAKSPVALFNLQREIQKENIGKQSTLLAIAIRRMVYLLVGALFGKHYAQ